MISPAPLSSADQTETLLYGTSFPMSDEVQSKDFVIPFGKAKIEREGTDLIIIAFSKMVGLVLETAAVMEANGVSCEVVKSSLHLASGS